jgi:hypothetical protein
MATPVAEGFTDVSPVFTLPLRAKATHVALAQLQRVYTQ